MRVIENPLPSPTLKAERLVDAFQKDFSSTRMAVSYAKQSQASATQHWSYM